MPVAAAVYHDDMFVPRELSVGDGELTVLAASSRTSTSNDGSAYSGGKVVSHLLDLK